MKSNILKFATCFVVAFGFMVNKPLSAQVKKDILDNPPLDGPSIQDTPSGYKTKLDCIKLRATAKTKKGVSQAYKITIDYGSGKFQTINRTVVVEPRNTSSLDCKCYPNSQNLTITYAKNARISRINMLGSATCK